MTGSRVLDADGRLRLAMNWNARGPFGVGPVEIDGAMHIGSWSPGFTRLGLCGFTSAQ